MKRVIDQLRELFPEEMWTYRPWHPSEWYNTSGWFVRRVTGHVPDRGEGEDTWYTEYRRSDSWETVPIFDKDWIIFEAMVDNSGLFVRID